MCNFKQPKRKLLNSDGNSDNFKVIFSARILNQGRSEVADREGNEMEE